MDRVPQGIIIHAKLSSIFANSLISQACHLHLQATYFLFLFSLLYVRILSSQMRRQIYLFPKIIPLEPL